MTITKKRGAKTPQMIESDIRYGFNKIMSQKRPIYLLTISNTNFTEPKQLQFLIRTFFNKIKNDYRFSFEKTNYLSVIEYPEIVSRGNMIPVNCKVHTHIVLETDLKPCVIEYYANIIFNTDEVLYCKNGWYDLEKISDRDDKNQLINYLTKQKDIFTDDNYGYKIELNSIKSN
jgi:hypothetical protein